MSARIPHSIGILGAGAWGTALASVAARGGHAPILWTRDPNQAEQINTDHRNTDYLPNVDLDPAIRATADPSALRDCATLFAVVPAQTTRAVLEVLTPHLAPEVMLVLCAKGIEHDTGKLMSTVAGEALPRARLAILSGPSFAADVARGQPTAITLAATTQSDAEALSHFIGIPTFRPYASDDMTGAQVGGAVKNVLAIACGIVDGCGLGTSARAALTTRGFAEMVRLGLAMGGRTETLAGLSGLGDLVLTCNSSLSRNNRLGQALGQGIALSEAARSGHGTVEGVYSAEAVEALARTHHVDMPIAAAVAAIVRGDLSVPDAIDALLSRPFTSE